MNYRTPPQRLAGVALAVASAIAAAQEPPVAPFDATLETVTVLGRIARPLVTTEATVAIVDAGRIESQLATDLRDLARYEPGIAVRGDPNRFGDESISIRGMGGNRIRLETDGVPRPAAFALGSYANAGRSLGELDFVRRIEILKGPASATYGSAAIGGIVAVSTLNAVDLLGDGAHALRGRAQYGTADHGLQGSLVAAGRDGGVEWLAGYLQREAAESQNEWRTLDANPRRARSTSWLGKLVLAEMDDPLRISVGGTQRRVATDVRSLLLQPPRFTSVVDMRGDDRSDELAASIQQQRLDAGPFRQLSWHLHAQRVDVDQRTSERRIAVPPRTPAMLQERSFRYEAEVVGGTAVAAAVHEWGGLTHRWSVGADLALQRIEEIRDGLQTSLPSGATTTTILGEAFPLRDFPTSRVLEAGIFVFDEIRRGESPWTWSPALRVDHHELEPRPDAIYIADNPAQLPVEVRSTSLSPRLGLSRRLSGALTAFGQYSHGFRSPPFEDVNIGFDVPQFRTRAIPNPDLRPEKSDHVELGLRGDGAVTGTASVFLARYRDFIESRVSLGVDPASGYLIFQSQNRARARIWGAELALRMPLGRPDGPWSASLSAEYLRGDDTAADRPLNTIEPARGTAGLEYAAVGGDWRLQGLLTVVASQDRVDESAGALARAGGFATFDLIAGWQLAEDVHLRAAVFNVFDRRYAEWSDIRGRSAGDPLLDLYTRPGRSVTLGITLQLD
ncbi:MAG: TonB-dependent receptor [Gammaproteobacteria bacterium]|nr:TonB-dependent receptor [Gammaproteobacteria bacterium]